MPKLCGAVFVAALCCALPMGAQGGPAGFPAKITDPPAKLPAGCPAATVAELAKATGRPLYKSLQHEIAALRLGHAASAKLEAAVTPRPNTLSGGALHQVVQMMTGMDAVQSLYLCASFVAAQGGGDAAVDGILRSNIVPSLNKMALQTWRLQNAVVMRNASAVEPLSTILNDRKQTDADLLEAVKQSGALLVGRDSFQVTCAEKRLLQTELTALAKSTDVDEFTSAAGLLETFLEQPLPCNV